MSSRVPERVLVVGSGSIAQRHVRNLLALGVAEVTVVTARDTSSEPTFADARILVSPTIPQDAGRVAIIANDSDRHVDTSLQLVTRDTHVLIEKPIASALGPDLVRLCEEADSKGLVCRVAYNLRLLGIMREIETAIRSGVLGTMLFARIEVGQWLPDWRPNRPHDASYSANAVRGGGVALDLSHEIDYMCMLFGLPTASLGRGSSTGVLGIETPDVYDGIYSYASGFSCTVHMDYLERTVRRRIRIVGTHGVLECDIAARHMTIRSGDTTCSFDDPALFDVASTYVDEVNSFFTEIEDPTRPSLLPSLQDACAVLALIAD